MLCITGDGQVELVGERGRRDFRANWVAIVGVRDGNNAPTLGALVVGGVTVIVSMMDAVAPPTSLPEGAFYLWVIGFVLIALETVGKGRLASLSFAQDDTTSFVLFFDVREYGGDMKGGGEAEIERVVCICWSLSRQDARNGHGARVSGEASGEGGISPRAIEMGN